MIIEETIKKLHQNLKDVKLDKKTEKEILSREFTASYCVDVRNYNSWKAGWFDGENFYLFKATIKNESKDEWLVSLVGKKPGEEYSNNVTTKSLISFYSSLLFIFNKFIKLRRPDHITFAGEVKTSKNEVYKYFAKNSNKFCRYSYSKSLIKKDLEFHTISI